jgi:protoporphyrinogen oxidase
MTATPEEFAAADMSAADEPSRWCVVGGGFLGMMLAYRLAQHGQRVRLVEAQTELGGLASAWQLGPITWDRHYHVTLLSDSWTRGLLRELGIEQELEWVETKTGFYANGQLHSLSNSIEYLRLPALGLIDKLRLAATIVYGSRIKDWRRLETIPVRDWLVRWSGRRTFERLWLPLLRAKLGENYQRASAAFIWATIARLYAARRTGLKKEMFGYVRGGYDRTIRQFARRLAELGVEIECGRPVSRIQRHGDGLQIDFADGAREHFDKVVVTGSCRVASRLCADLSEQQRARLDNIAYMGIVCASVLLDHPLADYYLTYLTDDWVPFTAVVEMSAMVNRAHLQGHSLVYLPKYVAPDDPLFAASDAQIESTFLSALERIYPHFRRSEVKAFRVSRVREVFAVPTLNYSTKVPGLETNVPNLYLANSAQIVNGTLNVNETVQLAEQTAAELLRQTTQLPSSHAARPVAG